MKTSNSFESYLQQEGMRRRAVAVVYAQISYGKGIPLEGPGIDSRLGLEVAHLRYGAYVQEQGKSYPEANHEAKLLSDPLDATGETIYVAEGKERFSVAYELTGITHMGDARRVRFGKAKGS